MANDPNPPRRYFLLHQLPPMRPYVLRLAADLGHLAAERFAVEEQVRAIEKRTPIHPSRAELPGLEAGLRRLSGRERELHREIADLGAIPGKGAEVLFPCSVDYQEAFFVWRDAEPHPTRWRFRDEPAATSEPIPRTWYTLFVPKAEAVAAGR